MGNHLRWLLVAVLVARQFNRLHLQQLVIKPAVMRQLQHRDIVSLKEQLTIEPTAEQHH